MAPLLQDLRRLAHGAGLVALEAAKRSPTLDAARSGDLHALVSRSLKNTVLSLTDLAGLTRGTPRHLDESTTGISDGRDDSQPRNSVVHFSLDATSEKSHDIPHIPQDEPTAEKPAIVTETLTGGSGVAVGESGGDHHRESDTVEKGQVPLSVPENMDASGGHSSSSPEVVAPLKRRRPREKRVPSTPLGKALGFAGLGAGLAWGTIQESAKRIVFECGGLR